MVNADPYHTLSLGSEPKLALTYGKIREAMKQLRWGPKELDEKCGCGIHRAKMAWDKELKNTICPYRQESVLMARLVGHGRVKIGRKQSVKSTLSEALNRGGL